MTAFNFSDLPLDDKLSAWLDDELTSEQRAEVDAWLRDHPEDAARVRLWAADRDAVRARLTPSVDDPVPTRLEQVVWNHPPATTSSGWLRWAAAVAVFVVGAAADDHAVFQHQDVVRGRDRGHALRHDDDCGIARVRTQRGAQSSVGREIERRERVVEDVDIGLAHQCPGD